jgi:hypothetical protein
VIAGFAGPDADGVARSPGGFAGHEASRDPAERPVLGGVVERLDGNQATLRTPGGNVTLDLSATAPLLRLEAAAPDAIHEGDRIAYRPGAAPGLANAAAALVLTGGAR